MSSVSRLHPFQELPWRGAIIDTQRLLKKLAIVDLEDSLATTILTHISALTGKVNWGDCISDPTGDSELARLVLYLKNQPTLFAWNNRWPTPSQYDPFCGPEDLQRLGFNARRLLAGIAELGSADRISCCVFFEPGQTRGLERGDDKHDPMYWCLDAHGNRRFGDDPVGRILNAVSQLPERIDPNAVHGSFSERFEPCDHFRITWSPDMWQFTALEGDIVPVIYMGEEDDPFEDISRWKQEECLAEIERAYPEIEDMLANKWRELHPGIIEPDPIYRLLFHGTSPEAPYEVRHFAKRLESQFTVTNTGKPSGHADTEHSEDFTCVLWFGIRHQFNKTQGACVKLLWAEWEKSNDPARGLSLSEKTIGERIGSANDQFKLRHVFRQRGGGNHSAWGTMIRPAGKGLFCLAAPNP